MPVLSKSLIPLCVFILLMGAFGSFILAEDPDYWIGFELQVETDEGIDHVDGIGHYCTDDYVELVAYVNDGYIFSGWYDENGVLLESSELYWFYAYNAPIFAKTQRGAYLDLMRMDGVLASTSRTVPLGETVTLYTYECGSEFLGWYTPEGELFTESDEYTFTANKDISLLARTDSTFFDGDNLIEGKLDDDSISDASIILKDRYSGYFIERVTGVTEWSFSLIPGDYALVIEENLKDGTKTTVTKYVDIPGDIHRKYCWMNGSSPEYIEWTADRQDYARCLDSKADRFPDEEDRLEFVDYTSSSMRALAATMLEKTANMTDVERADYVLKFVQKITEYQSDDALSDDGEYWKYPIETLVQRGGDCEDTSILYCSLMQAMGYKTALLIYEGYLYPDEGGHMAAGIALDYVKGGSYYNEGGLKYYYCETTSDEMFVGEDWEVYDDATVLPLASYENDIN